MTTWHAYVRLWRGRSPHSTVRSQAAIHALAVPVDDGSRWCGVTLTRPEAGGHRECGATSGGGVAWAPELFDVKDFMTRR